MPQSDYWPYTKTKQVEDVELSCQSVPLQKQLGDMEGEVKFMQMELAEIKRQRRDPFSIKGPENFSKDTNSYHDPIPRMPDVKSYVKDDSETNKLREELIRAKTSAEEERFQRLKYEGKYKDLEMKINNICCISKVQENFKESRKITEDEVVALKTQIRNMKEELEEMNITVNEKTEQLQEYRVKYLQAQQQVEELTGRLNLMEYENKQASDQIQIELQKMKMQFQEKLLELAPLPDLLKGAQIQLQEAKQLQKLAEDSAQQISNELHRVKEKLVVAVNSLNQEKLENNKLNEELTSQRMEFDEKVRDNDEMAQIIDECKCKIVRLEEKLSQLQMRYEEKAGELIQLTKDFEELKDETGRSINRAKERADSTRHHLQTQIAGLERQLISCRAQCSSYQKERDDIRQRVQLQIHSLKESFEMVEARFQGLQSQISFLKHYCLSVNLPESPSDSVDQNVMNIS